MTKLYDGKLTAWLELELEKILELILPPVGKFYEGKNSFEVTTKNPKLNSTKQLLVALARDYAEKQTSGDYEQPQVVEGQVHHDH